MRHEPWVVNQHPLGPSTDTAQENCFQNPYDATVGAANSRPYGSISTNTNFLLCLQLMNLSETVARRGLFLNTPDLFTLC